MLNLIREHASQVDFEQLLKAVPEASQWMGTAAARRGAGAAPGGRGGGLLGELGGLIGGLRARPAAWAACSPPWPIRA